MRKVSAAAVFTILALMAPLPALAHHKAGHPDFPPIRAASEKSTKQQEAKDCCAEMAKSTPEAKEQGHDCGKEAAMDMPADVHPDGGAHTPENPN